jgi:riboflavin kinase/FMN adenylyltransferase
MIEISTEKYTDITSIAIGGFDGMHIGHQHLFDALDESGAILVIETGYANLTPKKEREHYSHYPIIYFELNKIRHLNDVGFFELLLKTFPKLKKIVVGYDFHFGKDRCYNANSLEKLMQRIDGQVVIIERVCLNNESIHSHKIRKKLLENKLVSANQELGHHYTIEGIMIKGQGIGAKQLVATINLEVNGFLLPKDGVYATLTSINNEAFSHQSVSFIGNRSSTDNSFAIETHILNTKISAHDKVRISFISYIRDNKKFDTLELLKQQIHDDIKNAKKALNPLKL